jgi:transposase InsO family protein
MGEAHSEAVHDICAEYGVIRQTTAGYTPEHNAFIERWFCTNAKMSRCQMQQFDMEETFWEDSRRMASISTIEYDLQDAHRVSRGNDPPSNSTQTDYTWICLGYNRLVLSVSSIK